MNKMKYPDADAIRKLTQKLKEQGDISLEESDWVYSLFLDTFPDKKTFRLNSPAFDPELVDALEEWYMAIAEKIKKHERGNFIFTVCIDNNFCNKNINNKCMYPAKKVLIEQGKFEDLCKTVKIDKKMFFSPSLKALFDFFTEMPSCGQGKATYGFYETSCSRFSRAGMYYYPVKTETGTYTMSQFMEKLSPAISFAEPGVLAHMLLEKVFKIAAGTCEIQGFTLLGQGEIQAYLLAAFMRRYSIPCAFASSDHANQSIIFVEEKNFPVVKKVSEFPLKELVKNALDRKIIDQRMAKELLKNEPVFSFPTMKFVNASVEYLGENVRLKVARESMQKMAEKEHDWFDYTR